MTFQFENASVSRKSSQKGFLELINCIFQSRFFPLMYFSRLIASSTDSNVSK
jgi:hypothetical protein